jgi:hypothetical protein
MKKTIIKKKTAASVSIRNKKQKAELARELKGLRLLFNEITERYAIRVNGQIVEILRILDGEKVSGERLRMPSDKAYRSMLKKVKLVKVKLKKARVKDIARIGRAVSAISDTMPRQP